MNCSRRLPIRCWLACLLASALLAIAPRQEAKADTETKRPATAAALFARLAKIEALEAQYVEEKHLALLALPLKSEGSLYVLRPGYLARVVRKPDESRITITPDELRMQDRDGTEVLQLDKNESVRVFVTSIMRVFLGDRKNLERAYDIAYTLDAKDELGWNLKLTPRKKPLNEMLKTLELQGRGESVTKIQLVEPNGDKTITTIVKADSKRRFSAEEKRKLFGLEPEAAAGSEEGQ